MPPELDTTTENTEPTSITPEQSADEDAAFAASFHEHSGIPVEPAETTPQTTEAPEQSAAEAFASELDGAPDGGGAAGDAGQAGTQEPNAALSESARAALGTLSDDDLNTLRKRLGLETVDSLKQGLDKLAGTVGGMNRTIQALQSVQRTADTSTPEGAKAASAAKKLERAMLKELDDAGYGDVADNLLPVLERIVSATATPVAADNAEVERMRAEILRIERRELNRQHPNWQADIANRDADGRPMVTADGKIRQLAPDFVQWINSKDEAYRQSFMDGLDAEVVAAGLSEFKQFRASSAPASSPAPAAAPASAAAAARSAASSKQARLAAAAVPVGSPPASMGGAPQINEDDDLAAGFKAVREGVG